MSGGTVIKVENLGKKYVIGHQVEGDLRGSFSRRLSQLMGRSGGGTREESWALKDVSFEVKQGEAIGIIGRNGAGKSPLLKILSRITYPSTGRFEINGRVSSLLEVGTGFHPELTGRENIYLNGTILGMRRAEIRKKFDAIVDFSGVEKFLDTPVKHYSSGMKVRLAFAVAAHLEPEILIIDEVLAVGDAEFQKKCMGKMEEVSRKDGRTILFVSHQLNAIQKLCNRGAWLDQGVLQFDGPVDKAIETYTTSVQDRPAEQYYRRDLRDDNVFTSISLNKPTIDIGEDLKIEISLNKKIINRHLVLNINLYNAVGELICHILNEDDQDFRQPLSEENIQVWLFALNLVPGKYYL